jgi:hypothetical protein
MTRIGQAIRAAQRWEFEMRVCRRGGLVSRPGCVELAVRQKGTAINNVRGRVTTLLLDEALLACLPRTVWDLLGFEADERARVGESSAMYGLRRSAGAVRE